LPIDSKIRPRMYVKIPPDRLGAVIGSEGRVKKEISSKLGVAISIDTENSVAVVEAENENISPVNVVKAADIIKAIAYGFTPEKALTLLNDEYTLIIIDLKERVGEKPNHIKRIKGRIIGEEGRARRTIEELTGTYIHVGESHVAIIGEYERAMVAREAIDMLIEGRMHSTVYKRIDTLMRDIRKRERLRIW